MDKFVFKETQKFRTPEEELSYLRAHVKAREEELLRAGHFENARDEAHQDVIEAYRDVPLKQVVHESHVLPVHQYSS
jgi:hypothetical protein